jgi:hypothetical protein
MMKNGLKE